MNKKHTIILVITTILLVILYFLPFEFPVSIKQKGKLLPYKSWVLAKGTDGRLITYLNDNSTGLNNEFSVTQFERGDAVQFKFNLEAIGDNNITQGDTIGYIISNEIEKDIQKLLGELESAKASLDVQKSSEKESIIEAEKSKLVFAEKELEEQTKIYERKKKLVERDLISQQEFEADEARYELAKINISIAKERLRSVQSGAKQEEINYAQLQISTIKNEINVLKKRYESNNIIVPINGIINRTYSADTLLVVNDTSKSVIIIPVKLEDSKKIDIAQKVNIYTSYSNSNIIGEIVSINSTVMTNNNTQYLLVIAIADNLTSDFKPGLFVDCKIECGSATAASIISDFVKSVIN